MVDPSLIGLGMNVVSGVLGFGGARKARKKQERFVKQMMADRAARIAEAKGQYAKSRRGLMAENRAAMNAAIAGAPTALGASLMQGSTSANYMRSIYADAQRRAAEIGRQTAAGMADLSMLSPYDVVDPSTIGQSAGAEAQALSGLLSSLGKFAEGMPGSLKTSYLDTAKPNIGDTLYGPGYGPTVTPVTAANFGSNLPSGIPYAPGGMPGLPGASLPPPVTQNTYIPGLGSMAQQNY
jgi:hypothetical protein